MQAAADTPPSNTFSAGRDAPPLCVDLDHTLIRTDLLHECLLLFLRRSPWSVFWLPIWLGRGRAYFKDRLAGRACLDVARLPYRTEVVQYLRRERATGRRLILVTATNERIAAPIQDHLQLFDEVVASNGDLNLKGPAKARVLEEKFGTKQFDYIGDSRADLAVWRSSRRALVVSDSARFIASVNVIAPVVASFPKSMSKVQALLRGCRMHQWAKNLLVFVPILTAHKLTDEGALLAGAVAFLSFSLVSSSVYLWNDMLDLESDRVHVTKRTRPLAAGRVSIAAAAILAAFCLLAGLALGLSFGKAFLAILAIYLLGNLAYSIWLKRVVMLDVVVLACFYALRLIAGGSATGIGVSDWLLAFSVFFFFGLAMIKRYSELRSLALIEGASPLGRGYLRSDLDAVGMFGVASGMISVLVLVLYVMSPEVRLLYRHPTLLLLLCPLFLYWITRIWFKANRGEVPQDPVVFALTDRTSYIAGIVAGAVLYLATF